METCTDNLEISTFCAFKSYYVVWKQQWKEINAEKYEGLNRTM